MRKSMFLLLFLSLSFSISFSQDAVPLKATVITMDDCSACSTEATEKLLENIFSGIAFEKLDYKEDKAQSLIDKLKPLSLPLFVVASSDIEDQEDLSRVKHFFTKKDSFYVLNTELSGIFYFLQRPYVPKKIDLFLSLYYSDAETVIENIKRMADEKGLTFEMHFIFHPDNKPEIEEYLRMVSVRKLYPDKFWDYVFKRLKDIRSSFWNIAMAEAGIDMESIVELSLSQEARTLLEQNTALAKELDIRMGPVILVDNRRIFSVSTGGNSLDDLLSED